ncbi:MAG: Rv1355c family protein [Vicinamibacterales bacterium]
MRRPVAKIRLRERARDLRLPVLMETSDGGMLDVERFDLEPERDLLHGLVPGVNAAALRGMATKDKVPIVLRILGQDHLSARTAASLVEIGQTLSTWPQLASAVALGGSLVADAARRVLLGTLNQSGRVRVDVGRLVTDCTLIGNAGQSSHTESEASVMEMADAVVDARPLGTEDERGIDDSVRYLVAQACLAPSGGNCQPWRFVADGPAVDCYIDVGRSESRLNVGHRGSYVAMGAAVENMVLSAEARGVALKVEINTSASLDEPVFRATVGGPVAPSPSRLFEQIGYRCTNRHRGVRDRLHVGQRIALEREARGGRVLWFESQEELERLGMLHGRADRLRFLSKQMHRELIAEVRWTPAEAEHSRDGLDLRSLELSAADQAALNLLKQWPTLSVLKQTDGGRALEDMTRRMFLASSAIAVLQVPGRTPLDYLEGGRILQRVWLAATGEGVAVHPQGALVYSLARLEREPESLSADVRDELTRVRDEYRELVPANGGADVLMLRLSVAPEPSVRSLRRPLGSVLSAAPDARLARARSVQVPPGSRT